jgi:cell division protein FtsB
MMGIAYSGIQALEKRTQKINEQQMQIEILQKENAALKLRLEKLEK